MTLIKDGQEVIQTQKEEVMLEDKTWNEYIQQHERQFAELINYFRIYLTTEILQHTKPAYSDKKQKEQIKDACIERLPRAFTYSFGKGHAAAFEWLRTVDANIDVSLFTNQEFTANASINYQRSLTSPDVLERTLKNDINNRFLVYLEEIAENMYEPFMQVSRFLFFKGFNQGISDAAQSFGINPETNSFTEMSGLPTNLNVEFTPVMNGRLMFADNNTEQWALKWDLAFSRYDQANHEYYLYDRTQLMVTVHRTSWHAIQQGKNRGELTPKIAQEYLRQNGFKPGQTNPVILIVEYVPLSALDSSQPRFTNRDQQLLRLSRKIRKTLDALKQENAQSKDNKLQRLEKELRCLNDVRRCPEQLNPAEEQQLAGRIVELFSERTHVPIENCVLITNK